MKKHLVKYLGFLALFISVIFIASPLAFAGDVNTGEDTVGNPIEVTDVQGLLNINNDLNASYILKADLDLSAVMEVWKPIASFGEFKGNFNGDGHKIKGMNKTVSTPDESFGLFGYIGPGGKVENLTIDGKVYITNEKAVGSIAGTSKGYILNCYSTVTNWFFDYSSRKTMVGGIVGYNTGEGCLYGCQCGSTTTDTSDKAKFRFDSFKDPDEARKEFWYVGFMAGVADGDNWKDSIPDVINAHAGYPYAKGDNTLDNFVEQISSGTERVEIDVHYIKEDGCFHLGHNSASIDTPELKNVILLMCGNKRSAYYEEYWKRVNPKWASRVAISIDNKTTSIEAQGVDINQIMYSTIMSLINDYNVPYYRFTCSFYNYRSLMDGDHTLGGEDALTVIHRLHDLGVQNGPPGPTGLVANDDENGEEMFKECNQKLIDRIRWDLGWNDYLPVQISCDYTWLDDEHKQWEWLEANHMKLSIWTVNDFALTTKYIREGFFQFITKDAKAGALRLRNEIKYNISGYKVDDTDFPIESQAANVDFNDFVGFPEAPQ